MPLHNRQHQQPQAFLFFHFARSPRQKCCAHTPIQYMTTRTIFCMAQTAKLCHVNHPVKPTVNMSPHFFYICCFGAFNSVPLANLVSADGPEMAELPEPQWQGKCPECQVRQPGDGQHTYRESWGKCLLRKKEKKNHVRSCHQRSQPSTSRCLWLSTGSWKKR